MKRLTRDDGMEIWQDGSGLLEPKSVLFNGSEQQRIAGAIAKWLTGPTGATS